MNDICSSPAEGGPDWGGMGGRAGAEGEEGGGGYPSPRPRHLGPGALRRSGPGNSPPPRPPRPAQPPPPPPAPAARPRPAPAPPAPPTAPLPRGAGRARRDPGAPAGPPPLCRAGDMRWPPRLWPCCCRSRPGPPYRRHRCRPLSPRLLLPARRPMGQCAVLRRSANSGDEEGSGGGRRNGPHQPRPKQRNIFALL